ncbi:MAG: hypothetical protein ABIR71_01910 [Chthoniobacterales bacterium]
MKREDDQELWDLLGKAHQPALSPFFARNVVREIRQRPTSYDRGSLWVSLRRFIPASGVAAAMIAASLALQGPAGMGPESDDPPAVIAQLDAIDFEVVADLDNLLAMEEDSLWTDADVSTL